MSLRLRMVLGGGTRFSMLLFSRNSRSRGQRFKINETFLGRSWSTHHLHVGSRTQGMLGGEAVLDEIFVRNVSWCARISYFKRAMAPFPSHYQRRQHHWELDR